MDNPVPAYVLTAVIALLIAGCVTWPKENLQVSQLMPEEVAKNIIAKYIDPGWASRPALKKPCGPEPRNVAVRYSEITTIFYLEIDKRLYIQRDGANALMQCPPDVFLRSWVQLRNATEAQELATALVSLGASINKNNTIQ